MLLAGLILAACDDDNPSIDDYKYNYKIPQVAVNEDIPVGAYVANPWDVFNDSVRLRRLSEPTDYASGLPGPNILPEQELYRLINDEEGALALSNLVGYAKHARIDFLITPAVREHVNNLYPQNLNAEDTLRVNLFSGRGTDTFPSATNLGAGKLKYAIAFDINNWATTGGAGLTNANLMEDVAGYTVRYTPENWPLDEDGNLMPGAPRDTVITREERLYNIFKRLSWYFNDENYYTTLDDRPVLVLQNADKLYTKRSKEVYDNIRDTIKAYCGKDVYLIAKQQQWTPSARFDYFFLQGKVDAITQDNMCNVGAGMWDRVDWLDVFQNEHMKGNREYLGKNHPEIDYIPSASPSYTIYISNGNITIPFIDKDPEEFRTRCNIAKLNLGRNKMVLIESLNNWYWNSQIEPSKPGYGRDYGTTLLDVVAEEFKRK